MLLVSGLSRALQEGHLIAFKPRAQFHAPIALHAVGDGTEFDEDDEDGDGDDAVEYDVESILEQRFEPAAIHQFSTPIYRAQLQTNAADTKRLNADMIEVAQQLRESDVKGQRWCAEHYPGGYTSYGTVRSLNRFLPPMKQLEKLLDVHIRAFHAELFPACNPRGAFELSMVDCWANVMAKDAQHSMHNHDFSQISGTYYVQTPIGCSGISFQDPRGDMIRATETLQLLEYPVRAGDVILFPSWLMHMVAPNGGSDERQSVSFNYGQSFFQTLSPSDLGVAETTESPGPEARRALFKFLEEQS